MIQTTRQSLPIRTIGMVAGIVCALWAWNGEGAAQRDASSGKEKDKTDSAIA